MKQIAGLVAKESEAYISPTCAWTGTSELMTEVEMFEGFICDSLPNLGHCYGEENTTVCGMSDGFWTWMKRKDEIVKREICNYQCDNRQVPYPAVVKIYAIAPHKVY